MLLKLFLTFLKINCLSPSGPASIGLTQKIVVPDLITQEQFVQSVSISVSIPGSDAIQMAYQIGYQVHGVSGAIVSILGALLPTILIITLILLGLRWVSPEILKAFFKGLAPAMAVFLIFTAITLFPKPINVFTFVVAFGAMVMIALKVPVSIILIVFGLIGIYTR